MIIQSEMFVFFTIISWIETFWVGLLRDKAHIWVYSLATTMGKAVDSGKKIE